MVLVVEVESSPGTKYHDFAEFIRQFDLVDEVYGLAILFFLCDSVSTSICNARERRPPSTHGKKRLFLCFPQVYQSESSSSRLAKPGSGGLDVGPADVA